MNFDGRSIAPEIATELRDGVFCAEAEPLNTGPNSATSSPMRRFLVVVLFNHGAARRVSVSARAGRDTTRSDPSLTVEAVRRWASARGCWVFGEFARSRSESCCQIVD